MRVICEGRSINLDQSHIKASGGQGVVFARDGRAFKVYHNPAKAITARKIEELAVLKDQANIIRPETSLTNDDGTVVGYTMRLISDALTLPPFFTRAFRQRNRVTKKAIYSILDQVRETISYAHSRGVLLVDLNELNWLVQRGTRSKIEVFAIDVDSWQTPSYPATFIMETCRDRHAKTRNGHPVWTQGTDWFSFAVLATQLLVGIHPYRGRHPACHAADPVARLEERMAKNLSIFGDTVSLPSACFALKDIPSLFRQWLYAVLEGGERVAPPKSLKVGSGPAAGSAPVATHPQPAAVPGPPSLVELYELEVCPGHIVMVLDMGLVPAILTDAAVGGLCIGGQRYGEDTTGAFLAKTNGGRPKICWVDGDDFCVGEADGPPLFRHKGKGVVTCDGRVLVLAGPTVAEVEWYENDTRQVATLRTLARTVESGVDLYPGVAIQQLIDSYHASLFPAPRVSYQVRLPELEGSKVIDAAAEGNVLVVVTTARTSGSNDRYVYRFDPTFTRYDLRVNRGIHYHGISLAVLPKGVAALVGDDDQIELFSTRPNLLGNSNVTSAPQAVRELRDSRITSACQVFHQGDTLLLARGNRLYRLATRKAATP